MSSKAASISSYKIAHPDTNFLHLHWLDYVGVLRSRVLPISHALKLEATQSYIRVTPVCSLPLQAGPAPDGFIGAAGANILIPDCNSIRPLSPSHASVLCDVSEAETFHPGFDTSDPLQRCPRSQLRRVLAHAQEQFGISLIAGVELEFYLLDDDATGDLAKMDDSTQTLEAISVWSTASMLRNKQSDCVEACVCHLQRAGMVVQQYHAEGGLGQYEISLGPLPVLTAADSSIQAQEIIKRTAVDHGYHATFFPRPFPKRAPSGLHVHLSMSSENPKVGAEEQKGMGESFFAGILERLPMLCGFGLGSKASYSRVEKYTIGEWVSWGTQNRHTPLRKVKPLHWEIRCIDSTCNIHLVLAVFISAGILGVKMGTALSLGDVRNHIGNLNSEKREDLGIRLLLPTGLDEALDILTDGFMELGEVLPETLLRLYLTLKRQEQAGYAKLSEEQALAAYIRDY